MFRLLTFSLDLNALSVYVNLLLCNSISVQFQFYYETAVCNVRHLMETSTGHGSASATASTAVLIAYAQSLYRY
jgi:hypothetical protein